MKFIITEVKKSYIKAVNVETGCYDELVNDSSFNVLKNTIITVDGERENFMGAGFKRFVVSNVTEELLANTDKKRELVNTSEVKVGDLLDGAYVMSIGAEFVKNGKKMAYAYFSVK